MTDLQWIVDQVDLAGDTPKVLFDPNDIARELVAYGETAAAEALLRLDAASIARIGALAHRQFATFPGDTGPMLDTALCRAVVEHLEGKARPLARLRRICPKTERTQTDDPAAVARGSGPPQPPSEAAPFDARATFDAILDRVAALAPSDLLRRKDRLSKTTRQARLAISVGTNPDTRGRTLHCSLVATVELKGLDRLYRGKDYRRVLSTGWRCDFQWPHLAPPPEGSPIRWEITSDAQIDQVVAEMAAWLPAAVAFLRQFETDEGILGQLRCVFDLPEPGPRQLGLPAYLAATGQYQASRDAIEDLLQRFAGDGRAVRNIALGRRIIDEHCPAH